MSKHAIGTKWLTTVQAAALTGYSAAYLRRLARQQRVHAVRVGRDWLLNRDELVSHQQAMDDLGLAKFNPKGVDHETA